MNTFLWGLKFRLLYNMLYLCRLKKKKSMLFTAEFYSFKIQRKKLKQKNSQLKNLIHTFFYSKVFLEKYNSETPLFRYNIRQPVYSEYPRSKILTNLYLIRSLPTSCNLPISEQFFADTNFISDCTD